MDYISSESRSVYVSRINKVQDYIEKNIEKELNVRSLAKIATFSPYHFQRIYRQIVGESLYSYIKRLRLEKAAFLLLTNNRKSIQDIALSLGFSNQASFAKAFKAKYGVSSSSYRKLKGEAIHIEDSNKSRHDEDEVIFPEELSIKNEEDIQVVYIRYTGPYKGDGNLFSNLFTRLQGWAEDRDLIDDESRWFVVYHDFSDETDEQLLRLSVCMSIKAPVEASDEIGIMSIAGGRYAVGRFRVSECEYAKVWKYMYAKWLPDSGYMPDDRFSYEYYPPTQQDNEKHLVDIHVPIQPL